MHRPSRGLRVSMSLHLSQDRIRQWQAQGAAEAASPDALSVWSLPLSDHVIETPRAQTPQKRAPDSAPTWRQRYLEKERELSAEEQAPRDVKSPKKRLISDGHWKAKGVDRNNASSNTAAKNTVATPSLRLVLHFYSAPNRA